MPQPRPPPSDSTHESASSGPLRLAAHDTAAPGTLVASHLASGKPPYVYLPGERPDIEVLVGGVWCEGELRVWDALP